MSADERVKKCAKKKGNLQCFFSGKPGANYALLYDREGFSLAAFCCEEVVNIVREVAMEGLKIKGVSMANFTDAEATLLEVCQYFFSWLTFRGFVRAHPTHNTPLNQNQPADPRK